jgi:hypothetical protein
LGEKNHPANFRRFVTIPQEIGFEKDLVVGGAAYFDLLYNFAFFASSRETRSRKDAKKPREIKRAIQN